MRYLALRALLLVCVLGVCAVEQGWGTPLLLIRLHDAGRLHFRFLSTSGKLSQGDNTFVVEIRDAPIQEPRDIGTLVFLAVKAQRPEKPPILAHGVITRDTIGRYHGALHLPSGGWWQVLLRWDGPAGTESTYFSIRID